MFARTIKFQFKVYIDGNLLALIKCFKSVLNKYRAAIYIYIRKCTKLQIFRSDFFSWLFVESFFAGAYHPFSSFVCVCRYRLSKEVQFIVLVFLYMCVYKVTV